MSDLSPDSESVKPGQKLTRLPKMREARSVPEFVPWAQFFRYQSEAFNRSIVKHRFLAFPGSQCGV